MEREQMSISRSRTKRRTLRARLGVVALFIGSGFVLATSFFLESSTLAFAGLGFFFLGGILAYIRTDEYVKGDISQAAVTPLLCTIDQIFRELDYNEKAMYLAPKYLKEPEDYLAYVPKTKRMMPPSPEEIQSKEGKLFVSNSDGILVQPPGAGLAVLMERTLGTNFMKQDLLFLQHNLPTLFIENLELAQDFRMEISEDTVIVHIGNFFHKELLGGNERSSRLDSVLGWPISSAIACALAKATGRLVVIQSQFATNDLRTIRIEYSVLDQ